MRDKNCKFFITKFSIKTKKSKFHKKPNCQIIEKLSINYRTYDKIIFFSTKDKEHKTGWIKLSTYFIWYIYFTSLKYDFPLETKGNNFPDTRWNAYIFTAEPTPKKYPTSNAETNKYKTGQIQTNLIKTFFYLHHYLKKLKIYIHKRARNKQKHSQFLIQRKIKLNPPILSGTAGRTPTQISHF